VAAADGTAALGDFGIAHQGGSEHLTAEGVVLGTVRYLSPEQILGGEAVPASDLYALGITLYELATGDPPFTAVDPAQVLRQHVSARPVAPSQHEPAVAPALERLILELLAKQPKQRPASATEVADALASMEAKQVPAGRLTGRDARCGPAWADPRRRQDARRLVSVLAASADIDDPEALHGTLHSCTEAIERHGGTIERYLGDALVGLFGLAESHGTTRCGRRRPRSSCAPRRPRCGWGWSPASCSSASGRTVRRS
jgi:hypothetical protein